MLDNYRNMLLISLKLQLLSNLLLVDFPFFPDCSKIRVNFFTTSESLSCKPLSPKSGKADPAEPWSADSFLWGFFMKFQPTSSNGKSKWWGLISSSPQTAVLHPSLEQAGQGFCPSSTEIKGKLPVVSRITWAAALFLFPNNFYCYPLTSGWPLTDLAKILADKPEWRGVN